MPATQTEQARRDVGPRSPPGASCTWELKLDALLKTVDGLQAAVRRIKEKVQEPKRVRETGF